MLQSITPANPPTQVGKSDIDKLREVAKELEVTFLSEMLKEAGFGKTPDGFGGGAGEDQFASFMRQEQARQMVEAGGLGLAETFFEALKETQNG